ncbi:hypothetical protein HC026_08225 [Lactobacillus sp. LC28-10]|uniref:Lipoprotein n=1 Tax=Secundilactobacillus angelensis TaxID=2722706 RepID=A0ABX1L0D1_9LACO|nr:hypothetical protein [Secundilactobacillus angelensis]MCH5461988.1 hypothetical protein [Secundilactobacillus angelensis]NLR18910.1 hypothetical protein [Secundilactobacillus angelensis]
MKRFSLILSAALLSLVLAGCGKPSLSVGHKSYEPSGMTAVIKGHSNQKTVTYQINNGSPKKQAVLNGGYAITLPAKPYQQTVKLTAGGQRTSTVIQKSPAIMSYSKFKTTYNQALLATALSKKDQATAMQLQKQGAQLQQQSAKLKAESKTAQAKLKSGDTSAQATLASLSKQGQQLQAQGAKLKQTQAALAPALANAKKQVAGDTITAKAQTGVYTLKKTANATVRGNVDGGKLIGATLMVPTSSLKSKAAAKTFMTELAVLTGSTGANTQKVLKGFENKANKKNSSQTTTSTIHSKGIDFDLGYSKSTLYIYVTHH